MTMTRRDALKLSAAAGLPVLAATPAIAGDNPDSELLARAERFHALYREHQAVEAAHKSFRAEVEADPECPDGKWWNERDDETARAAHDRWWAFLEERGVWDSGDRWNASGAAVGAAANAVFTTPAHTAVGVLAKLRILAMATGPFSKAEDGDDDLLVAQFGEWSDEDENGNVEKIGEDLDWLALAIEDVERISARAGA